MSTAPERIIRIGTRGSELALWQANFLQNELKNVGYSSELVIIKTKGDQIQHLSFDKIEGKGFFTKELEDALLDGTIDMAVHSMKDLPTTQPEGLIIAGLSYREDPRDVLVIREKSFDNTQDLRLIHNAKVGTSSVRRKAQLLNLRPDLVLADIRGNVPTRLEKLRTLDFDAIMLASAGLERIQPDLSDLKVIPLHPREFVPAPSQGVLAYQCMEADTEMRRIIQKLHHKDVAEISNIERGILKGLGGGCQTPLGVYSETDADGFFHTWVAYAKDMSMPVQNFHYSSNSAKDTIRQILQFLQDEQ
ncbi:MAG: hydroxymethylbilane synthase [Saprospiraceae bacterium]|nr:hydroxymethylbilane synthase [Saprospiraceae bacterium]